LAVYQILTEANPVLREKAKPIAKINDSTIRLLDNLRDTLHEVDRGVGLSAPQIGIAKRAFIVDYTMEEEHFFYEMINPEILRFEGREEGWEGCLSVPVLEGLVPRAMRLTVVYMDREGRQCELVAEGFLAKVIQHETDHLNGVLFRDKAVEFRDRAEQEADAEDDDGTGE